MSTNGPMTQERLNEIQGRIDAAAPGPWHHEPVQGRHSLTTVYYCFHNGDTVDRDLIAESTGRNATLITHAPTDLTDLLAEVHRLRDELAKAREVTEDKVERAKRAFGAATAATSSIPLGMSEHTFIQGVAIQHGYAIRIALQVALGGGDDAC